jgi:hypothetical protein
MKFSILLFLAACIFLPQARADDDSALEKRIESKMVADHQKSLQQNKVSAKAVLDQKADAHENSASAAANTKGKSKAAPPRKPAPKKKAPPKPHR